MSSFRAGPGGQVNFITVTAFSGALAGATQAACDQYNIFNYTLGAAHCQVTASNPVDGGSYIFILHQDGAGSRVGHFKNFSWPGGTAPTLSTGAGDVDVISGVSDGTVIYADVTKNFEPAG